MDLDVTVERPIVKVQRGEAISTEDIIVKEFPLAIHLNGQEIISLMCLPKDLSELAVGFLFSDGLLSDQSTIDKIEVDKAAGAVRITAANLPAVRDQQARIITSGCGKGSIFQQSLEDIKFIEIDTEISLQADRVIELISEMQDKAEIFRQTGGVHSSGLARPEGRITYFFEDIGRHNAVDKIFGACFLADQNIDDSLILTSGRVSSEIVIKVAKRRVPFIISRAAPTDFAIDLASELGICVIGFARGQRFTVYTKKERIV